jgi:hypothetical protein
MLPRELDATAVLLTLRRLYEMTLPEETVQQLAYHLGWLAALDAVLGALDVPEGGPKRASGPVEARNDNRPGEAPAGSATH